MSLVLNLLQRQNKKSVCEMQPLRLILGSAALVAASAKLPGNLKNVPTPHNVPAPTEPTDPMDDPITEYQCWSLLMDMAPDVFDGSCPFSDTVQDCKLECYQNYVRVFSFFK